MLQRNKRNKRSIIHWSTHPQREQNAMKKSSYGVDWLQKAIQLKRIIDCLKMSKISDKVIKLIEKTMKNWRVQLTAGGKSLVVVKIQRGIFPGDALSPLLFIIWCHWIIYLLSSLVDTNLQNRKNKNQPPNVYGRHQTVYQKRNLIYMVIEMKRSII